MREQIKVSIQQRIHALYRYVQAMEHGDDETLTAVLLEAQHDEVLERMLLEVNEVYQIEDRTVVHPDDVLQAQEMLLTVFSDVVVEPQDERAVQATAPAQREQHRLTDSALPVASQANSIRRITERQQLKPRRSRVRWYMAAVAALLLALVLFPATGLATQFLSLFRVQQLQPVQTIERPEALARNLYTLLRNFGTIEYGNVADQPLLDFTGIQQEEVGKHVSFRPLFPTYLPDGVGRTPQFSVSRPERLNFVFDRVKAQSYLNQSSQSDIVIPTQLNGAKFTVHMDAGMTANYFDSCSTQKEGDRPTCKSGKTSFVIAEIPSPVLKAEGSASLSDLRGFLLSLPKLPQDARTLLEHADVNTGIVPVPIPPQLSYQQITVKGSSALLITYNRANLLAWQDHGVVYLLGLFGGDTTQLIESARSLQ